MIENNNFPWYLQQSDAFLALYYGFFDVAELASPLGIGDAFDPDKMTGQMLFRLGSYYGMQGSPSFNDGLIYSVDNWSELKTWTGGISSVAETFYRNFLKAKAYAYGRPYSLETLKGVLDRVFNGITYSATITEGYMSFTINITASQEDLRSFIDMRAFDLFFIGKPVGINVDWTYTYSGSVTPVHNADEIVVSLYEYTTLPEFQQALNTRQTLIGSNESIQEYLMSYNGSSYSMFFNADNKINANEWTAVYAQDLTTVVAYVKSLTQINTLPTSITSMRNSDNSSLVYFPLLGQEEEDAVNCCIIRHKINI